MVAARVRPHVLDTQTQTTPRNLFGFKDGTANIKAEDTAALDEHVWVAPGDVPGDAAWMAGGTYLVARRVRMHIEVWDRSRSPTRSRRSAATRGGGAARPRGRVRRARLRLQGLDGGPAIPVDSHVRLAHHSNLNGVRILRRGYNFTDGSDGRGTSTPGCSSSRSCATPAASSSRCSGRWRGHVSTSTSSTPARRCSPAPRRWRRTATGAPSSSPDASPVEGFDGHRRLRVTSVRFT